MNDMMTMEAPASQLLPHREETTMTPSNKDCLIRNIVLLSENLILDYVMDELIARKIINFDERHQIYRNDATDREKVERLVMIIIKKPNSAFYELLESIRRTGQRHIALVLEDEDSLQ